MGTGIAVWGSVVGDNRRLVGSRKRSRMYILSVMVATLGALKLRYTSVCSAHLSECRVQTADVAVGSRQSILILTSDNPNTEKQRGAAGSERGRGCGGLMSASDPQPYRRLSRHPLRSARGG